MKLLLWTSAEVDEHLSGEAEILRSTYFGQLILTPESLVDLHRERVAPIRERWHPEVHQTIDAERVLRRMLVQTETWNDLQKLAKLIKADVAKAGVGMGNMPGPLTEETENMMAFAGTIADALIGLYSSLDQGDLDLLQQQLVNRPNLADSFLTLPRSLRSRRYKVGLMVTNVLSDIRSALTLFDNVTQKLSTGFVTVLAEAGCGKTQLSAQMTSSTKNRPAGILLYGRDLHAGNNLDDLARKIIIHGKSVPSIEALMAAVDSAGQRAHCRLPVIIDGLNEAEDPRDWKAPLASLIETLRRYPYVLFVCTLRPAFASEALPEGVVRLNIPDFGHDTIEAIRRYFTEYRINPADAELPIGLLGNPLTLRLFCEVTNPSRNHEVGIEAMPGSLTALFDRYLKQAAQRIAELAPRTHRYYEQDVRNALDIIATALWDQHARGLDERDLRKRIGDDVRPWNESIVRALEQEGVILRMPGKTAGDTQLAAVYDALAGHIIADALIDKHGRSGLENWLRESTTLNLLTGSVPTQHPLAMDTFRALVSLLPRRLHGQQLWQLLQEPLRSVALERTAELEGAFIETETVKELAILTVKQPSRSYDVLDRMRHTRGSPVHPLNSEFLNTILRPMTAADRDLRWTEWIRRHEENVLGDLQRIENRWHAKTERSAADQLRARWVMWTLTSTVRKLRDQATRTLYWFGRSDPAYLFVLTLESLEINDPYVPERMIAASYGIAMAMQNDERFISDVLLGYARKLFELIFDKEALFSTTHILMRDYAKHTIDIALSYKNKLLNSEEKKRIIAPFTDMGIRAWGESEDRNEGEYRGGNYPFGINFDNYTIGYLIPNRRNYDFKDPEYLKVKATMWWRIYTLGYSLEKFGDIDKQIAAARHQYGRSANGGKTDRYGKKYCWIAYYEIAGLRQDNGLLRREWETDSVNRFTVDIDPSFPGEANNTEVINTDLLGNRHIKLGKWIQFGGRPNLRAYLIKKKLIGEDGPWVLIDGYIDQEDLDCKRGLFVFPRGLFVKRRDVKDVVNYLKKQDLGGRWVPEIPSTSYVFAGEIPWSDTFHYNGETDMSFTTGKRIERVLQTDIKILKDGKKPQGKEEIDILQMLKKWRDDQLTDKEIKDLLRDNKINIKLVRRIGKKIVVNNKTYKILIPVVSFSWESGHSMINPGQHAYVPAREVSEHLRLHAIPQTFDFYDSAGRRATITIKWGEEFHTTHKLFYIRKDLFDKYLKDHGMQLVWAIWGERQFKSKENLGLERFAKKHKTYHVFQEVLTYKKVTEELSTKRNGG
jgi:hypothetical protein